MTVFEYKTESEVPDEPVELDAHGVGDRVHRTALFIDISVDGVTAHNYLFDRVTRLLQSVNSPGIMVDIIGVEATRLVRIPTDTEVITSGSDIEREYPFPASGLSAWAAARGYTMVLFALPAGYEFG